MNIVSIKNLTKSFDGYKVLDNINLQIKKGDIIGIKGSSGTGKTTLLRILHMLETHEKGNTLLFGHKPGNGNSLELQRRMVMVFQKPVVFNSSVYHNVSYGLKVRKIHKNIIDKKVKDILKQVKLNKLHTNALKLSGGEIQKIAIARALIVNPELLLLDEPTANLDAKNIEIIENLLKDINKKFDTSIIITSHDIDHIKRISNKMYDLSDGKLKGVVK